MIIKSKKSQIEAIKNYFNSHSDMYKACIAFGECTRSDANSDCYIDLAISVINPNDYDNSTALYDLYKDLDDITNGAFSVVIIEDPYLSENTKKEIREGEIIYELS